MRILVDCCNYFFDNHNHGDRAVYQAVAARLLRCWPNAQITWITLDRFMLQRTLPNVTALQLKKRHTWEFVNAAESASPRSQQFLPTSRQKGLLEATPDAQPLLTQCQESDLVVAVAGGCFSDHFAEHARGLLDTLEIALAFDKPTALLSAGFEMISDLALLEKSKRVLPRLGIINCREPQIGPRMLSELGVPPNRVYITGDEAIETAYQFYVEQPGNAIGVNLRRSAYSGIEETHLAVIRNTLQDTAQQFGAPLLGIPISMYGPSDLENIRALTAGYEGTLDIGTHLQETGRLIRQVGQCRMVVTGSYHAAVFALAQGIPVVALAQSLHYRSKLSGLAEQFQQGCTLVDLKDDQFAKKLYTALGETWNNAPTFGPSLLQMTRQQIEKGREAYQQLVKITSKPQKRLLFMPFLSETPR